MRDFLQVEGIALNEALCEASYRRFYNPTNSKKQKNNAYATYALDEQENKGRKKERQAVSFL